MTAAPPWVGRTGDLSDTQRYTEMTPSERLARFLDVCELAHAILLERPDAAQVLARADSISCDAEAAWLRLVGEARRAREAR